MLGGKTVKLNIGKKTAVVPTAQQVPRLQNHPNGVFAESIGLDVVVCIRYNVKFSSHAKQHTKFGESCFSGAGKTFTTKSARLPPTVSRFCSRNTRPRALLQCLIRSAPAQDSSPELRMILHVDPTCEQASIVLPCNFRHTRPQNKEITRRCLVLCPSLPPF